MSGTQISKQESFKHVMVKNTEKDNVQMNFLLKERNLREQVSVCTIL